MQKENGFYTLREMTEIVQNSPTRQKFSDPKNWVCPSDHLAHAVALHLRDGLNFNVLTWNLLSERLIDIIRNDDEDGQRLNDARLATCGTQQRRKAELIALSHFVELSKRQRHPWIIALQEVDAELLAKFFTEPHKYGSCVATLHNKNKSIYRCVLYGPSHLLQCEEIPSDYNFISYYAFRLCHTHDIIVGNYHLPFGIGSRPFQELQQFHGLPMVLCGDFNSMFQRTHVVDPRTPPRTWATMLNYLHHGDPQRSFSFTRPLLNGTHINCTKNVHRSPDDTNETFYGRTVDCFDQILVSGHTFQGAATQKITIPNAWWRM